MLQVNGKEINGANVKNVEVIEPLNWLQKNKGLNTWFEKEVKGKIIVNLSIDDDKDKDKVLDSLKSVIKSGIIQIDDKFYNCSLNTSLSRNLDTSNFYVVFNYSSKNTGNGICPIAPTGITYTVDGKKVLISFVKGTNATLTKLYYGDKVLTTEGNSFEVELNDYDVKYQLALSSVYSVENETGKVENESNKAIVNVIAKKVNDAPSKPTGVVVSVDGRYIDVSFTKGEGADRTIISINDKETYSYENNERILLDEFDTEYVIKLKSVSFENIESEYTSPIKIKTDVEVIPTAPSITDVSIVENKVTFTFSKGENAKVTEFLVDSSTYIVDEGNTLVVDISGYEKEFKYKARSISKTYTYSNYTEEGLAKTREKNIIPTMPYNLNVIKVVANYVTIQFAKAIEAEETEILVGSNLFTTKENTIKVELEECNKEYTYKARSISKTGGYSDWTEELKFTTGEKGSTPTTPSNIVTAVRGRNIKLAFDVDKNTDYTEVEVNGDIYTTEGKEVNIFVEKADYEYTAKVRCVSQEFGASEDVEVTFTSEKVVANVSLNKAEALSGTNYENLFSTPKEYVNGLDINIDALISRKANRYSINGTVIDGKFV